MSSGDIYDRAITSILSHQEATLRASVQVCSDRTESPIEGALYLALAAALTDNEYSTEFNLRSQHQIDSYRVDFLLELNGHSLVIECDGHAFHERTKEQAARDRSRDRELTGKGFRVIRFTGSEIWKDTYACAKQAVRMLEDIYHAHEHAVYKATEQRND